MADFLKAIPYILQNEGGYVNDPSDSGGETYAGISRKDNPYWAGWKMVDSYKPLKHGSLVEDTSLDVSMRDFYKRGYWDPIKGDQITNQSLATFLFDWYVNSKTKAVEKLQEVLGINPTTGVLGPITLQKINESDSTLLEKYYQRRLKYYHDHVAVVPKDAKFLTGWVNRTTNLYNKLYTFNV